LQALHPGLTLPFDDAPNLATLHGGVVDIRNDAASFPGHFWRLTRIRIVVPWWYLKFSRNRIPIRGAGYGIRLKDKHYEGLMSIGTQNNLLHTLLHSKLTIGWLSLSSILHYLLE
jgi:hypothetical protein